MGLVAAGETEGDARSKVFGEFGMQPVDAAQRITHARGDRFAGAFGVAAEAAGAACQPGGPAQFLDQRGAFTIEVGGPVVGASCGGAVDLGVQGAQAAAVRGLRLVVEHGVGTERSARARRRPGGGEQLQRRDVVARMPEQGVQVV